MGRIDPRIKESIFKEIHNSGKMEQDYVVELMDVYCEQIDEKKVINQYKKARANRLIASFKDENGVRDCFTVKEGKNTTYVNISTSKDLSLIKTIERNLNKQIVGTSKSLKKAIRRRAVLEGQVGIEEIANEKIAK